MGAVVYYLIKVTHPSIDNVSQQFCILFASQTKPFNCHFKGVFIWGDNKLL